ncbi:MAG: AI-2E family transporter [Patescibacteria group bacterium]|nr:AI-2E family transporter [Patescibacteria group bacterium]
MLDQKSSQTVDVIVWSFLKILAIILIILFLYLVRDIVLILFVSVILASAVIPWVDKWQEKKIPRILTIVLIYLVLVGIVSLVTILIIPAVGQQLTQLAKAFPFYYEKVIGLFQNKPELLQEGAYNFQNFLQSLSANMGVATKSLIDTIGSIMGGLTSFVLILIITFYISVKKDSTKIFLELIVPQKYQVYTVQLVDKMQNKIGQWLKGQLFLCLIIGILSYVGLLIINVKYALLLALIAGIMEIIPFIGPTLGALPAILLAFMQSPLKALLVLILYIVIQQLENNLIVPHVMKKAVGLNPIVTIIAIAIGAKLAGVLGAIIAVPVVASLSILVKDLPYLTKSTRKVKIQ